MAAIADKLRAIFAENGLETSLDADAIKQRIAKRHGSTLSSIYLQERHLAMAFQELVFERIPDR